MGGYNSGSRISLSLIGAEGQWSLRGAFMLRNAGKSTEAGANSDGTMYVTTRADLVEADVTFSDKRGLPLPEDLMGALLDVTAIAEDMSRSEYMTQACVVGSPSTSYETGEIQGLRIACPRINYRRDDAPVV
ncbi:MAG: hypothetical protein AAFO79_00190 [Pseudomonadota bacterium]